MVELSVIIPARSEEFLKDTIEDILRNSGETTEIIAILDGEWANPPITDNPRVHLIYVPVAIGQRAASNLGVKLAQGKYVAKTDAHCAFDKGFDRKMLDAFKETGDNVVMVPIMHNLHVYDWKCYKCGKKVYQDVKPICPDCGTQMKKKMVWKLRKSHCTSYCFDSEPHFQYFNEWRETDTYKEQLKTGITETCSLQGSFFMMTKEKYLSLNVDDESLGSWGNQGLSVACKFWLSGGRVLVNHKTWYAHCFRTKGDVFGFPYPQSGREVQKTKQKVRDLFFNKTFEGQIYPLRWLIEKFKPSSWKSEDIAKLNETTNTIQGQ
jgi:glycosyltransferase involved in cell wall biosynthesis